MPVTKPCLSDERGVALLLLAVLTATLITVIGLAVNTAWLTHSRSQAQAAVDAAALAAAAGVPSFNVAGDDTVSAALLRSFNGSPSDVTTNKVMGRDPTLISDDLEFITYNGKTLTDAAHYSEANGVQVTKSYAVNHFLGNFMGSQSSEINVTATAVLGGVSCAIVDLPIMLIHGEENLNACDLGCGDPGVATFAAAADEATGSFFTIGEKTDAAACKRLVNGTQTIPRVCAQQVLQLNNGVIDSCMQDLADRCDPAKQGGRNCVADPWDVTVAVVSRHDLQSNTGQNGQAVQQVPIMAFTRISITQVNAHGSDKSIRFRLKCDETSASPGGARDCGLKSSLPALIR